MVKLLLLSSEDFWSMDRLVSRFSAGLIDWLRSTTVSRLPSLRSTAPGYWLGPTPAISLSLSPLSLSRFRPLSSEGLLKGRMMSSVIS